MISRFINKSVLVTIALISSSYCNSVVGQNVTLLQAERFHGYEFSQKEGVLSKFIKKKNPSDEPYSKPFFVNSLKLHQAGADLGKNLKVESVYEFYAHPYTGMNIPYASVNDKAGNLYVTGATSSEEVAEGNFITMKYDSNGNRLWEATQPGTEYAAEFGLAITMDASGYPIATGIHWNGHDMDIQTIKYDVETGAVIWQSIFDGNKGGLDVPVAITVDLNGNVILTGFTYTGNNIAYLTLKYSENGNLLWSATDDNLNRDTWNEPSSIAVDQEGNIAVTGFGGNENFWQCYYTLKYNPDGTLAWKHLYQDSTIMDVNSIAHDVTFDTDGNCYVTGTFNTGQPEIRTIKYNSDGIVSWVEIYSDSTDFTNAYDIQAAGNNTVYVAGRHQGDWTNDGLVLISYHADGTQNWVRETNNQIEIRATQFDLDGNNLPVIAGLGYDENSSDNRIRILKYSAEGDLVKETSYLKPYSPTAEFISFVGMGLDSNDNIYVTSNMFYTSIGSVFEMFKLSFDSLNPDWDTTFSNNGSLDTEMLYAVSDENNNTYATGRYGTIENEEYITNYILVKYNNFGEVEWEKVFNPGNGNGSNGIIAKVNSSGDILVYLLPNSFKGFPIRLKKYNATGNLIWEKEKVVYDASLYTFFLDKNDNIYLSGSSKENQSDPVPVFATIKFNNSGDEVWTRYLSSSNPNDNIYVINSGKANSAGEVVLTGAMGQGGFFSQDINLTVLKYTGDGQLTWINPVAVPEYNTSGTGLLIGENDNIYINGVRQNKSTYEEEMIVTKLSESGDTLWFKSYGENPRRVRSYDIRQLSTGNLVISGFSVIDGMNNQVIVVSYDTSGNKIWNASSDYQRFYNDLYVDAKDTIYLMNQMQISTYPYRPYYSTGPLPINSMLKIDQAGQISGETMFIGPAFSEFIGTCMVPLKNGRLLFGGTLSHELSFFRGLYFFDSKHTVVSVEEHINQNINNWLGQNFPNPVNGTSEIPFSIDQPGKVIISVYDLKGCQVAKGTEALYPAGRNSIKLDLRGLNPGIYLYQIETENYVHVRKMIVL